ncbi:MAG: hypothetical protein AAFX40_04445, partial [Cyanobacteria bacterium J06639_1]
LLTTEQWQAALDVVDLASASNVFEPLLPLYRAFAREQLMQWEEAAAAYDAYVQTNPNALGYYRGAIAHWQAGDTAAAARSFQLAAKLDPAFPLYTSEAGLALAKLGVDRSAIELLSQLPPNWTQPGDFVILARLAHQQGMADMAEAAISQALGSGTAVPPAWVSDAGAILSAAGRIDEATRYLERVAASEQADEAGLTAESYGQPLQVRATRARAIAAANLSDIYLQQEQPALALSASQNAIALDPLLPVARNNFGVAALALDRPNEAAAALEEAVVLDPEYWQAHRNLGFAYAYLGDRERARKHLQLAMDAAPSLKQVQQINQELVDLSRRELPAFQTDEERAES